MNASARAMMTKDLTQAQGALERAFRVAANAGELDLAKSLRDQGRAIGEAITKVNGGPVKIRGSELLLGGS